MIGLLVAVMLQPQADPCHAVPAPRPLPAGCPRWEVTERLVSNLSFIDAAPVRRAGDRFEILFRTVLREDDHHGVRSSVHLYRYDCRARTVTLVSTSDYNAAGARLQLTTASDDAAFTSTPPRGSRHAALLNRHCR